MGKKSDGLIGRGNDLGRTPVAGLLKGADDQLRSWRGGVGELVGRQQPGQSRLGLARGSSHVTRIGSRQWRLAWQKFPELPNLPLPC